MFAGWLTGGMPGFAVVLQLVWTFSTEVNDVDFAVSLRSSGSEDTGLLPSSRHDASDADVGGSLPISAAGTCALLPSDWPYWSASVLLRLGFFFSLAAAKSAPARASSLTALIDFAADVITFGNTFSWMNAKASLPGILQQ